MAVNLQAESLHALLEHIRGGLVLILGDDHAAHIKTDVAEGVDKAEGVLVIGDAEVAAALVALDVVGGDDDKHLGLVFHVHEHPYLAVGLEAGQNTGGVVIVKEFAAELQIELAAELLYAGADIFGLGQQIFVVVESDFVHLNLSSSLLQDCIAAPRACK